MLKRSSLDKINDLLINKHTKLVTLDGSRICILIDSKLIIIDTKLIKNEDNNDNNEDYEKIINGCYNNNMKIQNNILKFFKNNISID
jgi:hypothetical protein